MITYDEAKDLANIAKHGVSLARASDLEIIARRQDTRVEYGEDRFQAFGLLDGQPYFLAYTIRDGAIRAISLRRAHQKEFRRYVR